MKREDVLKKLYHIFESELGLDLKDVNEKSDLRDDVGADSLDVIEIVMSCEEIFDIEIEDLEAEQFKTVGDVVNYVCKVLKIK